MSVVLVASSLSLVDGVVFAGQSDVLSATRFLAVVFFFVSRAELISSRCSRSRGVSVVINLPRCGFAASCGVQRCCVFAVLRHLHYKNIVSPTMNKKLDSSVSYSHPHNLNSNNSLFLLL